MFMDDIKLYRDTSSQDNVALLWDDLNALANWCNLNTTIINKGKCHVVNYLVNAVAFFQPTYLLKEE